MRKAALEGLGYITFCWLYRKFSQDFKEVSKPAHRPVQPTPQTSRFTQFCVNTASRYHLQIKSQYERSLPGCVTQLGRLSLLSAALLVVEAPGAALFLCMVLIVHIDNTTGFQAQWCAIQVTHTVLIILQHIITKLMLKMQWKSRPPVRLVEMHRLTCKGQELDDFQHSNPRLESCRSNSHV